MLYFMLYYMFYINKCIIRIKAKVKHIDIKRCILMLPIQKNLIQIILKQMRRHKNYSYLLHWICNNQRFEICKI